MNSSEAGIDNRLFGSIHRHLWVSAIIAGILTGGIGIWAGLSSISGAVVAAGKVVVESNLKEVQHQEGGIIKKIMVKDGDMVTAGDLLISLDDIVISARWRMLNQQLDELSAQKSRLLSEQIEEDNRAEIVQRLQDTRISIVDLEKQKIEVKDQLKRLEIRAPRSGFVHNLAVHTVGGVIAPGETVMTIVPKQDMLLIEAQIRPVDIEQLSAGQNARVRFPSFDQRTTPELQAQLKTISADLLQDQVTGEMYYQARFIIPDSELGKLNGKSLIPGMPVEVFATTEERTVLSYLIKPVSDQIAHSLKER